jgi:hypothetical protein
MDTKTDNTTGTGLIAIAKKLKFENEKNINH